MSDVSILVRNPSVKTSTIDTYQAIGDDPLDYDSYIGAWALPKESQTVRRVDDWNKLGKIQQDQDSFMSMWPGNEDQFTHKNLLINEENQIQELIFQIGKSFTIDYHLKLANRILTLFNDAKEEDPHSLVMSVDSLHNFYNFIRLNSNLMYPSISLTPGHNIYASWRGEHNRVFSVHFLPRGEVSFVIFKPNDKHPNLKIRLSGIATTDTLLMTIESSGVWDWISE